MKLFFNNKNIDMKKGCPVIEHIYTPDFEWNKTDPVTFTCRYFKSGELTKYLKYSAEGTTSFDLIKIFTDQVLSINNLEVEGKLISKEEFLALPASQITQLLINDVALHLVNADALTPDEQKN